MLYNFFMIQVSNFYKSIFDCKVYKISLDAGCTCPNRDGTKGRGGCIFCSQSGSGDFIQKTKSIKQQFENGISLVEKKAKGRSGKNEVLYLPYFQSFTSTYGDFTELKKKYIESLSFNNSCGIAIATRPDCLSFEFIEFLKEIKEKHFIQIELGLQTSNENTEKLINRCYTNKDYINAVKTLQSQVPEAHIVTHVIFGLPGETQKDMLSTINFIKNSFNDGKENFWGIKITNLYVVQNTVLEKMYKNKEFECLSKEEYFKIVQKALALLPENAIIHRLTGDPPKKIAIAPEWALNKRQVLNEAKKLFLRY